jgi:hypothetical protein
MDLILFYDYELADANHETWALSIQDKRQPTGATHVSHGRFSSQVQTHTYIFAIGNDLYRLSTSATFTASGIRHGKRISEVTLGRQF